MPYLRVFPSPPLVHICDVILVWRQCSNRTVSVLQHCIPLWWYTIVRAVLNSWSTGLGFDLAWFSSLSSECLCMLGRHGAIYILKFFVTFFPLLPLLFGELSLVGLTLYLYHFEWHLSDLVKYSVIQCITRALRQLSFLFTLSNIAR